MRTWLFSAIVAVTFLIVSPEGESGEIIKETFELSDGRTVSGWVYQSESTWRYRRTARYWGGYAGFYGGFYSFPCVHSYSCYSPSVISCGTYTNRRIAVAPTVRPRLAATITPRTAPVVASVSISPRPSPTPSVKPKTVVRTITSKSNSSSTVSSVSLPQGTTTMKVYRRP